MRGKGAFVFFIPLAVSLLAGQARLEEAKRAVQAQRFDRALALLEQLIGSDPGNGEAHYYLAQLYARRNRERAAIDHFLRALELLPDREIIWSEYGKWLLANEFFEEAERVYRHLVRVQPASVEYCKNLGLARYGAGDPGRAVETYGRCLELQEEPDLLYLSGLAQRATGRTAMAREQFLKGLARDPSHRELNYQMSELLLDSGEPARALDHLRRLAPDDPRRLYAEGLARLRLGELEKAEAALLEVVSRNPTHTRAHYQLGVLFTRLGDGERSRRHFERFRRLEQEERNRKRTRARKEIVRNP